MTLLGGGVVPFKVRSGEPFNGHPTLRNGLTSVLKFNEEIGTRFDSHGINHLTDNNTVGFAAGKKGNSASFVAANLESLSCAAFLGADAPVTFSVWVYFTDGNQHTIIDSGNDGNLYLRAGVDPHGVQFVTKGFTVVAGLEAGSIPLQNNWYFLTASYDPPSDTARVSVNAGTPATAVGGPNVAPASFIVGNRTGDIQPMQGRIDELLVHSRVLTLQETVDLYAGGIGLFYNW